MLSTLGIQPTTGCQKFGAEQLRMSVLKLRDLVGLRERPLKHSSQTDDPSDEGLLPADPPKQFGLARKFELGQVEDSRFFPDETRCRLHTDQLLAIHQALHPKCRDHRSI